MNEQLNVSRIVIDHWKRKEEELRRDLLYERARRLALEKIKRQYIPIPVKISLLIISLINTTLFFFNFTHFPQTTIFWVVIISGIIVTAGITWTHPFTDKYKMAVKRFGSTYRWPKGKMPKWAISKR